MLLPVFEPVLPLIDSKRTKEYFNILSKKRQIFFIFLKKFFDFSLPSHFKKFPE